MEKKSKPAEVPVFPLWQLFGLCWFSIIMLRTVKQQCHKPTDLQVISKKNKIIPLVFAVGLVGRLFLILLWLLPLPGPALWKS